jgi:L,D-peptidoglycan transpeptidase YkuD (ErfK/YbiS/YcfS/YnhG family)
MCSTKKLNRLVLRPNRVGGSPAAARLHIGPVVVRAAIGKTGLSHRKREGDGKTPLGTFKLKAGFFRGDRMLRICCTSGISMLRSKMGWCDQPGSGLYNRPIPAGHRLSHERLWRDDHVYDVVFPTSHNENPRVQGAGSAIFFHLARLDYAGTEGCIAISAADMRRLLPRLGKHVELVVTR